MTEPRDNHHDRQTDAATAAREPDVRPELIKDLDVTSDDADVMGGGTRLSHTCHPSLVTN
jgi:hypothetical protein